MSFLLSFYVVVLSVFVERQCFSVVFASCPFIVKLLSFCCRFVVAVVELLSFVVIVVVSSISCRSAVDLRFVLGADSCFVD